MAEAVVTSAAGKLVSKFVESLFAPIGRQFGYLLCYKSYVLDLQNGLKELEAARERVQHSVVEAENNGKLIESDVKIWLESVEEETEKADNLLKRGESAKSACFRGWLPNPVVRHPIGREVKKMIPVIQKLREESQNSNFQKVYRENPPIGFVAAITSTARPVESKEDVLESRSKIMEEVMKAIVDDKVIVVGVWGPGGVGKSKLLEDVERRVKKDRKPFDLVAKANVSRNQDIKGIQDEIADALGLHLMNEKSAPGRAYRLCERLESGPQKNILIILDNLWEKLELKKVGIPCGDDNKVRGCKLLLSSRNRDVLRTHMGSDREFSLNNLEHEEARRLFERTVGYKVTNPEFEPWVDGVVKNSGGLPLLIISLAKRLKHGDLAAWRNASTNRDLSDVKSLLEQSYEDVKDERIRSVFLICALGCGKISLRDSLICCMGLDLYEKFSNTIDNARDRLIVDVHSLQDSSLLLDSNDEKWVRMHDISVDVAISITSTDWYALVGRKDFGFKQWSKTELRKCTAISFIWVGLDELPEKLDCPNLRILILAETNWSLKIPELFFESMEKLQVLDLTGVCITSLPSSIEFLGNLKSLTLVECCLEDVTVLGKLTGLQFLNFSRSAIPRLPKEIGELTELRVLDLTRCTGLKIIEPEVLGSLVNLEELYMEDSFDQWEVEGEASRSNASLAELKYMKKLRTLYITIPHSTNLSSDLPFGNLNKYKIRIGGTKGCSGEHKESRTLELKLDSGDLFQNVWMQECLGRTQDLCLDGLQDGSDSIHNLCIKGFLELKHLHVKNNFSVHYVVDSTHYPAFTRLESLVLENLSSLEKIYHDCLAPRSLGTLKIVKVKNCGEIKHLFHSFMTKNFSQLEEIEITRCHLMQQIVANAESDEYIDEIDDDASTKSFKLRRLTLQNLPEMTSFCKTGDHSVIFFDGQQVIKLQNLEAISVERCQLIREVFDLQGLTASGVIEILSRLTTLTLSDLPRLEHIWNKNPRIALCFRNLRALKVQNCENLRFLFSSSMAKTLQQITEIEIASCKLLGEIIDVEEEDSKEAASIDTLEFPMLTSLSLEELPNLKTFSYGKYRIHCPNLTRLRIAGCPKMMTFSSFEGKQQSMATDTGSQQAFVGVGSSLPLPAFFDQNVLFPCLEELTFVLCGLMKIWHNELSEESFCKLASITVRDCENLSHIFPSTLVERFRSPKMIEVVKCTSLEALMEHVSINSKERQKHLVFIELEEVKLWDLPRLNALVPSSTKATLGLPSLTNVGLRSCHDLRYLFTNDTYRTLDKLEKLDVSGCNNMREVVVVEESGDRQLKAVKFSRLHTLKLRSLKRLISFSSGSCAYEFPSLRNLSIVECTKLKAFTPRMPVPRVETMNGVSAGFDESPHSLFDDKVVFPMLEELRLRGIQSIEFWENEMPNESICRLKVLVVKQCPNLLNVIPAFMWKRLLHCMESLTVEECPRPRNLFPIYVAKSLVQLQHLILGGCEEMEYIVAREEETLVEAAGIIAIPQLVTLYIHNMPKLRSFYQGNHISEWPSLKNFTVEDCKAVEVIPQLEILPLAREDVVTIPQHYIFCNLGGLVFGCYHDENVAFPSNFLLHRFPNLEELSLDCSSFKEIFPEDAFGHGGTSLKALGNLKRLRLTKLCNPSRVRKDGSLMAEILKQIEDPYISECPSLSIVFPTPTSFHSLTELELEDCDGLVHVGTCSVVTSPMHLTRLILRNCAKMEVVVTDDGNGAEEFCFPNLEELIFDRLPSLESFSPMNCIFTFPSLESIVVMQCPKMDIFCKGTLRTPKLDEVLLSEEDDEGHWEGDLNTTIQTLWRQTDSEVLSDDDDEKGPSQDDLDTTIQSFEA
ncbi:uncharacterized protein LOC115734377 [Rhodamnia argentea]|uniref:Uncharacterized protein LOC115734377 n=1 Tax=Rhodamnia argentea TaxID=178133 RepID=A0ABM3HH34_9MYRT|nr:uncharacterized protein LOC115734377 [Rhodamnia argentea]